MRLHALQADITQLEVDAIVNAANEALIPGGGVDGAINRAAGPELKIAMRAHGGCPTGEPASRQLSNYEQSMSFTLSGRSGMADGVVSLNCSPTRIAPHFKSRANTVVAALPSRRSAPVCTVIPRGRQPKSPSRRAAISPPIAEPSRMCILPASVMRSSSCTSRKESRFSMISWRSSFFLKA
jgi:Macro domain